jgi:hypothetical protein
MAALGTHPKEMYPVPVRFRISRRVDGFVALRTLHISRKYGNCNHSKGRVAAIERANQRLVEHDPTLLIWLAMYRISLHVKESK